MVTKEEERTKVYDEWRHLDRRNAKESTLTVDNASSRLVVDDSIERDAN